MNKFDYLVADQLIAAAGSFYMRIYKNLHSSSYCLTASVVK